MIERTAKDQKKKKKKIEERSGIKPNQDQKLGRSLLGKMHPNGPGRRQMHETEESRSEQKSKT